MRNPVTLNGAPYTEVAEARRYIRIGLAVLIIGFGAVGIWLGFAPLHGGVVARGFVKVEQYRYTVQHQDGGIVKQVNVQNGSHVRQGDPLLTFEDVQIDATESLLTAQLAQNQAKEARLVSEMAFAGTIKWPATLLAQAKNPEAAEVMRQEANLFSARRQNLDSQIHLLETQIGEAGQQVIAAKAQVAADHDALRLAQDELVSNEKLLKDGYVSATRITTLQRTVAEYQAKLAENQGDMSRSQQIQAELRQKILGLRNAYIENAATERKEVSSRIGELSERKRPVSDSLRRTRVVAPFEGDVVDLRVHTSGAVVGPREPILDIVPSNRPLLIEASIPVDSINDVRIGLPCEIRFNAFDSRTTPLVDGSVSYVSADQLTNRTNGEPYFQVQVRVESPALKRAGITALHPGMSADVLIRTRERTALAYMLDPITRSVERAFRER